jgi:hypothetical protein
MSISSLSLSTSTTSTIISWENTMDNLQNHFNQTETILFEILSIQELAKYYIIMSNQLNAFYIMKKTNNLEGIELNNTIKIKLQKNAIECQELLEEIEEIIDSSTIVKNKWNKIFDTIKKSYIEYIFAIGYHPLII